MFTFLSAILAHASQTGEGAQSGMMKSGMMGVGYFHHSPWGFVIGAVFAAVVFLDLVLFGIWMYGKISKK